mmetsp:Transcript_13251/g.20652  ORF Transcript_13251/g.20652 Transcript_13251/m.20652 type:complete len:493 (-) Transcript_13251:597-2075(-)
MAVGIGILYKFLHFFLRGRQGGRYGAPILPLHRHRLPLAVLLLPARGRRLGRPRDALELGRDPLQVGQQRVPGGALLRLPVRRRRPQRPGLRHLPDRGGERVVEEGARHQRQRGQAAGRKPREDRQLHRDCGRRRPAPGQVRPRQQRRRIPEEHLLRDEHHLRHRQPSLQLDGGQVHVGARAPGRPEELLVQVARHRAAAAQQALQGADGPRAGVERREQRRVLGAGGQDHGRLPGRGGVPHEGGREHGLDGRGLPEVEEPPGDGRSLRRGGRGEDVRGGQELPAGLEGVGREGRDRVVADVHRAEEGEEGDGQQPGVWAQVHERAQVAGVHLLKVALDEQVVEGVPLAEDLLEHERLREPLVLGAEEVVQGGLRGGAAEGVAHLPFVDAPAAVGVHHHALDVQGVCELLQRDLPVAVRVQHQLGHLRDLLDLAQDGAHHHAADDEEAYPDLKKGAVLKLKRFHQHFPFTQILFTGFLNQVAQRTSMCDKKR